MKQGAFEARFTPSAQTAFAPMLVEGENGDTMSEVGGKRYSIGRRE